jgi:hypothetical protein
MLPERRSTRGACIIYLRSKKRAIRGTKARVNMSVISRQVSGPKTRTIRMRCKVHIERTPMHTQLAVVVLHECCGHIHEEDMLTQPTRNSNSTLLDPTHTVHEQKKVCLTTSMVWRLTPHCINTSRMIQLIKHYAVPRSAYRLQ